MKHHSFLSKAAWLLLVLGLAGCYRDPKFATTPEISFKEIRKFSVMDALGNQGIDSVVITLHFQDGDGDLGLTQTEIAAQPEGKHNFEVNSLVRRNGTYLPLTDILGKPVNNSGDFFPLNPTSKSGPIEGTLDYSLKFYPDLVPPFAAKDTVKFEIRLFDKAGHPSNWIETAPISVNGQN